MIRLSTVVDILIIIFLLLGTYAGWRKGLIKSLVNFVGLITVVILSFYFKTYLANFLIDTLPFFNFAGLNGLSSINILIYNIISFVLIVCFNFPILKLFSFKISSISLVGIVSLPVISMFQIKLDSKQVASISKIKKMKNTFLL